MKLTYMKASIQCHASETPFKWRLAGGPMMAHLEWYFDPLCPQQLNPPPPKKKKKKKKNMSNLDHLGQNFLDQRMQ